MAGWVPPTFWFFVSMLCLCWPVGPEICESDRVLSPMKERTYWLHLFIILPHCAEGRSQTSSKIEAKRSQKQFGPWLIFEVSPWSPSPSITSRYHFPSTNRLRIRKNMFRVRWPTGPKEWVVESKPNLIPNLRGWLLDPEIPALVCGLTYLVGGLEHQFYFPISIGLLIIPIDFHIFQRGGPTTNQHTKPTIFCKVCLIQTSFMLTINVPSENHVCTIPVKMTAPVGCIKSPRSLAVGLPCPRLVVDQLPMFLAISEKFLLGIEIPN